MILKLNGYPVSAPFGSVDAAHFLPHRGLDIAAPAGTPVEALRDGIITAVGGNPNTALGKSVAMQLTDGSQLSFGHLSDIKVQIGQKIHAGQIIAVSGNTGLDTTGPHVHVSLIKNGMYADPAPLLKQGFWSWFIDRGKVGKIEHTSVWEWLGDKIAAAYHALEHAAQTGALDIPIIVVVMVGIIAWMIGMTWHKKYVFWLFLGWLVLRGAFS